MKLHVTGKPIEQMLKIQSLVFSTFLQTLPLTSALAVHLTPQQVVSRGKIQQEDLHQHRQQLTNASLV